MSKPAVPCHNCENRQVGCHSNCEAYATYRRENAMRNGAKKDAMAGDTEMRAYVVSAINRNKRRKDKTHLGWKKGK